MLLINSMFYTEAFNSIIYRIRSDDFDDFLIDGTLESLLKNSKLVFAGHYFLRAIFLANDT